MLWSTLKDHSVIILPMEWIQKRLHGGKEAISLLVPLPHQGGELLPIAADSSCSAAPHCSILLPKEKASKHGHHPSLNLFLSLVHSWFYAFHQHEWWSGVPQWAEQVAGNRVESLMFKSSSHIPRPGKLSLCLSDPLSETGSGPSTF